MELSDQEIRLILRTILADHHDHCPGWYWFKDLDTAGISAILETLAWVDRNEEVRVEAIKLLSRSNLELGLDANKRTVLLTALLGEDSVRIRSSTLDYIAKTGGPEDMAILDQASLEGLIPEDDLATPRFAILLRHSPCEATSLLDQFATGIPEGIRQLLPQLVTMMSREWLVLALKHEDETLRELASRELSRRGELVADIARELMADSSAKVKEIAARVLIEHNALPDPEKLSEGSPARAVIETHQLLSLPKEALLEEAIWYGLTGYRAYHALACDPDGLSLDQIRRDLNDRF